MNIDVFVGRYTGGRSVHSFPRIRTWMRVDENLAGAQRDASYRGTSPIRKHPSPWDRHWSLGIGIR